MRTVLIIAMLASPALAIFNVVIQGRGLKQFLDTTPKLASSLDLENFKRVAGRQMWAALAQAVLLLIAPACFFWGLMIHSLTPADFVWILLPSVVVILVARSFRSLELRAWSIPAADQYLTTERDRIVKIWRTKAFPDW
jgi:drug/metabolite transporter (DMT)-like permease